MRTPSPLDFVYDRTYDIYNLTYEAYEDDEDLVLKVQTGKGDPNLFEFRIVYVDNIFGGTEPKEVEQNSFTGENDIVRAEATSMIYFMDEERYNATDEWWGEMEQAIID